MKRIFLGILLPFKWLWKALSISISVLTSLAILASIILLLTALLYKPEVKVPDDSILVFAPKGDVVEQRSPIDPLTKVIDRLAGMPIKNEVFLQDALDVILSAAEDPRIKAMLFLPDKLGRVGLDQAESIAQALKTFKESGKKVIAMGNSYSQVQYYLASEADEVYLNPMGSVRIKGFGLYRIYVKELLDRLAVEFHVFRVGTFKSALEPFTRTDMSPAAEESNMLWLNALWDIYISKVATNRMLSKSELQYYVDNLTSFLEQSQGSQSEMALAANLVDGLKTENELIDYLTTIAGPSANKQTFKQVSWLSYLQTVTPKFQSKPDEKELIAIIPTSGNIMNSDEGVNQIGSRSLIKKIRKAKFDGNIKALVLRISTGGGSAFASEQIRQELVSFKKTGKPLVVSMGSMAASGGYWLSANADIIVASPATLTGSIGIFGAIPTIEKSLAKIGIYGDGVGTSQSALFGNPMSEMSARETAYHQGTVENGYRQFLTIVAEGRNMSMKKVQMVAEGRIWDGTSAKRIGLVDTLGGLEEAIAEAARIAGVPPENSVYFDAYAGSNLTNFLDNLDGATSRLLQIKFLEQLFPKGTDIMLQQQSMLTSFTSDPENIYAHSLLPEALFAF